MNKKCILDYETVDIDLLTKELVIIDQTKLPGKIEIKRLSTAKQIWEAIYLLQVRGAPAIGVAAAFGIYILATQIKVDTISAFYEEYKKLSDYLVSARPTAVNLSWAINRMDRIVRGTIIRISKHDDKMQLSHEDNLYKAIGTIENISKQTIAQILQALQEEAVLIKQEDIAVCKAIGEYGLTLVKPKDGILTHCNAGQLATCKYGTATAPIYLGYERGYDFKVYADETRPLLQGARLTAFELNSAGVDVTLICDNMCATVMKQGKINAIFVGCDRVAANGDTANKIGTSVVATVAKHYGIPVYICAPTSTIDLDTKDGEYIKIEERPDDEVTQMWYKERMAPEGIKVYNPAFDVTDHELIAGIVTEYGIAYEPYTQSLQRLKLGQNDEEE